MPEQSVVCLHRSPGSSRGWDALIDPAIDAVGHVYAPTMPGLGNAPVPAGFECLLSPSFQPGIDTYARWLGRRLDEQRIECAHLVRHGFGGPFGLAWGAGHLDRAALTQRIFELLTRYGQPRPLPRSAQDQSAEIVVLDDSGHWPHLDDPRTVQRYLILFLKKAVSDARKPDSSVHS